MKTLKAFLILAFLLVPTTACISGCGGSNSQSTIDPDEMSEEAKQAQEDYIKEMDS